MHRECVLDDVHDEEGTLPCNPVNHGASLQCTTFCILYEEETFQINSTARHTPMSFGGLAGPEYCPQQPQYPIVSFVWHTVTATVATMRPHCSTHTTTGQKERQPLTRRQVGQNT